MHPAGVTDIPLESYDALAQQYGASVAPDFSGAPDNHAAVESILTKPRLTATPIASVRPVTFSFSRMCVM
jgi:hypothetical protein